MPENLPPSCSPTEEFDYRLRDKRGNHLSPLPPITHSPLPSHFRGSQKLVCPLRLQVIWSAKYTSKCTFRASRSGKYEGVLYEISFGSRLKPWQKSSARVRERQMRAEMSEEEEVKGLNYLATCSGESWSKRSRHYHLLAAARRIHYPGSSITACRDRVSMGGHPRLGCPDLRAASYPCRRQSVQVSHG